MYEHCLAHYHNQLLRGRANLDAPKQHAMQAHPHAQPSALSLFSSHFQIPCIHIIQTYTWEVTTPSDLTSDALHKPQNEQSPEDPDESHPPGCLASKMSPPKLQMTNQVFGGGLLGNPC